MRDSSPGRLLTAATDMACPCFVAAIRRVPLSAKASPRLEASHRDQSVGKGKTRLSYVLDTDSKMVCPAKVAMAVDSVESYGQHRIPSYSSAPIAILRSMTCS